MHHPSYLNLVSSQGKNQRPVFYKHHISGNGRDLYICHPENESVMDTRESESKMVFSKPKLENIKDMNSTMIPRGFISKYHSYGGNRDMYISHNNGGFSNVSSVFKKNPDFISSLRDYNDSNQNDTINHTRSLNFDSSKKLKSIKFNNHMKQTFKDLFHQKKKDDRLTNTKLLSKNDEFINNSIEVLNTMASTKMNTEYFDNWKQSVRDSKKKNPRGYVRNSQNFDVVNNSYTDILNKQLQWKYKSNLKPIKQQIVDYATKKKVQKDSDLVDSCKGLPNFKLHQRSKSLASLSLNVSKNLKNSEMKNIFLQDHYHLNKIQINHGESNGKVFNDDHLNLKRIDLNQKFNPTNNINSRISIKKKRYTRNFQLSKL